MREKNPTSSGDQHLSPAYGITDPRLVEICTNMAVELIQISGQLTDLAHTPIPELKPPIVSQETVDTVISEIVPEDRLSEVIQMSKLFKELEKKAGGSGQGRDTLLVNASSTLTYKVAATFTRDETRRVGSHFQKTKKLAEFWLNSNITPSSEQYKSINDRIGRPLAIVLDNTKVGNQGEKSGAEIIDSVLSAYAEIDPAVDLNVAKLLIFNGMVEIFKRPSMIDTDPNETNAEQVRESEFGPVLRAAELVGDIADKDRLMFERLLNRIRETHVKGRFLSVPSRRFKEDFSQLESLARLYTGLFRIEKDLEALPSRENTAIEQFKTIKRSKANLLVATANKEMADAIKTAADIHDSKLVLDDPTPVADIWKDTLAVEAIIIGAAKDLLTQLEELNLEVDQVYRSSLTELCHPIIGEQANKNQTAAELQELKHEIDMRLEEFNMIDKAYRLSNKKLRERNPDLITLARDMSESIGERAPLDEDTARALVGLLTGVYWERTGENATPAQLAACYAADAVKLRQLSNELEYLGQSKDSNLLKLTNLLEELIDAGVFEDKNKYPELDQFIDLALEYIIARDKGADSVEIVEEAETKLITEPTTPPLPEMPPIPVETIRQAVHEDILVFPPGATVEEVVNDYTRQIGESNMPLIEWERIQKMIELRDQFVKQGMEVEFIRTKHASWQVLPFFVLETRLPNDKHNVVVVESPVYGNATYIFREADDRLPWRDVIQQTRQEARDWGAVPAVHVDSKRLDIHFQKVWNRVISELTVLR